MNKFLLAAVLALGVCAHDAGAQVIVSGYQQGYYNQGYANQNYFPAYGGGFVQPGGYNYGYSNYSYQSYPTYNYPVYGYQNTSPSLSAYYNFYRRGAAGNGYNSRRFR